MSKEMTPKENVLLNARASVSWIYSNLLGKKANFELLHPTELKRAEEEYISWVSYLLPIEQALIELEELKRYPTADEVCKALSEYLGCDVKYNDYGFLMDKDTSIKDLANDKRFDLISLIGQFYKGLEANNDKL